MPLTLITGRANAGKTGRVLSIYREALKGGHNPVLVVPSQPDAERLVRELARTDPMGVDVRTFERLVADLWTASGDGRTIVTGVQRRALLLAIMREDQHGMVGLVERVVEHASSFGERWRTLEVPAGDCFAVGTAAKAYARELARRGFVERGEAAHHVAGCVSASNTIIFHRFSTLTPSQERFVIRAGTSEARVAVSLTWEQGVPATEALDQLVSRISEQADQEHVRSSQSYTEPELARIEAELFMHPEPRKGQGAVSFLLAEGYEAEADIIAGQVAQMIAGGTPAERIAVVFRRPESRVGTLRRAFAEAGLRMDLDAALPFVATSFGRAFASAVRFLANADRDALIALIRSGYFCDDRARAQAGVAQWLRAGTTDQRVLLRGATDIDMRKGQLLGRLSGELDPRGYVEAWDEAATLLFAQKHGRCDGSTHIESDALARGALTRALSDAQGIDDIALSPRFLLRLLEGLRVGTREVEREGRVQVTSVERVRGRRFEAVILGGLNAGEFPAAGEDMLASLALHPLWRAAGVPGPEQYGAAGERAMLYTAVTRPRTSLTLARLASGPGGEEAPASVYWEELRDFYRAPTESGDAGALPSDRHLGVHESGIVPHATSSLRAAMRAEVCTVTLEPGDREARLLSAAARSEGRCQKTLSSRILASRAEFSPSALELYARCPYQWFVSREVGADRLEPEVDGLLKGSLAHSALEWVYGGRGKGRTSREADDEGLAALATEAVSWALAQERVPDQERAALKLELAPKVYRSLRADRECLPGFEPWSTEWSFGSDEGPEVRVGPYGLRGRVDRVDVAGKRAAVIDYKLGESKRYAAAKLQGGLTLQALLYAHAVEQATGFDVVAALYRGLGDGGTRGMVEAGAVAPGGITRTDLVEETEFREAVEWAVGEAVRAADGIRAGRIDRRGGEHCTYCPVVSWCGERER